MAPADPALLSSAIRWLLTGRQVFESDRPVQVMTDHARGEPGPPSRRYERPTPPAPDEVVTACLAKAPAGRPRDALELERRLLAAAPEPWAQDHARPSRAVSLPRVALAAGPLDPTRAPRAPGGATSSSASTAPATGAWPGVHSRAA